MTWNILPATALVAACLSGAAQAQTSPSPDAAASAAAWSRAHPIKGPSLAASANRELGSASVPSARGPSLAAQADADIARRNTASHLTATRENLKGDQAKQALARQQTPATYDRDIQMGDKDHTEQVTDLKISIKKPPSGQ